MKQTKYAHTADKAGDLVELPSTPKEAKKRGEKFYFTGVPCKRGHISRRYAGSAVCAECTAEKIRQRYATTHAAVKPIFLGPAQAGMLPETPPHAEGIVDREAAQRAFDSLNQPGGLLMAVDVDPMSSLRNGGYRESTPERRYDARK